MDDDVAIFLDLDNVVIGALEVNLTFDIDLLLARIHELSGGRIVLRRAYGDLSATVEGGRVVFGEVELDLERLLVYRQGRQVYLTPTEFRLLRYLVTHPNRPFSREALVEAVWGYDSSVGNLRTVDVHIRHLRAKLEIDPASPHCLVTVRGVGYKFVP